jgi:hypothetical protein
MKNGIVTFILILIARVCFPNSVLLPMDEAQKNHLKAYGLVYFVLTNDEEVKWLLNYRGGSFMFGYSLGFVEECRVRGITFEVISPARENEILKEISSPSVNMELVQMARAPRVAVYSPKNEIIVDETDAVITVLEYAEIPFDLIYDKEVLEDSLVKYDWLHLHHEDFTGQNKRFMWRGSSVLESKMQDITAAQMGYAKVAHMKLAVAKKIKAFCASGGYLFAMCSAAETFDIALAADGIDIIESYYDGDDMDPDAQTRLNFDKSLAFENFTLELEERRFSDINVERSFYNRVQGYFSLFNFSAKWDVIPSLLTQNHTHVIKEFTGLTTAFNKFVVKPESLVMGENKKAGNVRYIYGELGNGHWTYYSGHNPEHAPGRGWGTMNTNLDLYPNSPGYRLILNNVLFPSAKRKKQKT